MLEAKLRTQAQVLSKKKKVFTKTFQAISKKKKKKKRSSRKFFKQSPQKNVFQEIFQALHKILAIQKIVLSSSRGQANFRGLDLRGQGQGLQNVSSRTPPLLINSRKRRITFPLQSWTSQSFFFFYTSCFSRSPRHKK